MLKLSDLQSAFDKARNENDAEDLKTEALDIGMFTLELIKSQREIDAKFRAILSDEQKKTYDDSKRIVLPRRQPQR
jgi:Rod binding domain-containing protein